MVETRFLASETLSCIRSIPNEKGSLVGFLHLRRGPPRPDMCRLSKRREIIGPAPPRRFSAPSSFQPIFMVPLYIRTPPDSLVFFPAHSCMSVRCTVLTTPNRDEQAQAASLKQELTAAKQEASTATEAARNVEQQLLLASSAAAAPKAAADTGTAALTETLAVVAAAAEASAAGAVTASAAPATAVAGGGVGLEIEKGPSPDALRLEELKAELQAATAAKKKVGRTSA